MKEEFRSAFANWKFILAFSIMLICLFGFSLPNWVSSVDWGDEFRPNALHLSIGGIFFGGLMLLLPFCSCIPYATSQVDEIVTSNIQWKVLRGSVRKYAINKMLATAVSGAVAVSLAFAIHAILWNLIALPCDPMTYPYHETTFGQGCVYNQWYAIAHGLPMYVSMTLGIALCGAVWSITALAAAVWVPDRLMAVVIPVCIYYLWMCRIFYFLFGWNIPAPSTLFNDALTWELMGQSLLSYAVLLVVSIFLYILGLKRRVQNG